MDDRQGYGNSHGSLMASPPAVLGDMPLDQLAEQLSEAHKRIDESIAKVGNLADRLLGPSSDKQGGAVNRPERPGKIGSLNAQADGIHAALSVLEQQIVRLSPLGS